MSGFAACVLAEPFLAVRGTWCSSGLGTSLRCRWGQTLTNTRGWERSCMLAPVPVQRLPPKHSGCNAFLSLSKAFSRRNFASYSVAISTGVL